ncbi:MAG: hypothetical protein ACYC9K_00995 [Sulfuricaulis sp.]
MSDERESQVAGAAKQAQDANNSGYAKPERRAAIVSQAGMVAAVALQRRAADKPQVAEPPRPEGRHETAAPAVAAPKSENAPVTVKVAAAAPVAIHVTPPNDTRQPTVVRLPSSDDRTPDVTVHVQPAPRDFAGSSAPIHPDVALLHDKISDLTRKTEAAGSLAVVAMDTARAKSMSPWYERAAVVALLGVLAFEAMVHWQAIKALF